MAWEKRRGRDYYYLKRRAGDRVRSVYVGADEDARIFAELAEAGREQRSAVKAARHRTRVSDPDAPFLEAIEIVETLARGALLAYGFHTHKRQWRRSRNG